MCVPWGNLNPDAFLACPEGTFKPTSIPGDISSCVSCPGGSRSWSPVGSTSEEQCTCQEGYHPQVDQGEEGVQGHEN